MVEEDAVGLETRVMKMLEITEKNIPANVNEINRIDFKAKDLMKEDECEKSLVMKAMAAIAYSRIGMYQEAAWSFVRAVQAAHHIEQYEVMYPLAMLSSYYCNEVDRFEDSGFALLRAAESQIHLGDPGKAKELFARAEERFGLAGKDPEEFQLYGIVREMLKTI